MKVLFTVRNKTTLIEKTQLISVAVNPSDFSFNATRTNTGQVVNTPVIVNLNLTQTGGTGDTYSLMFNTSSTGTFKYGGITYTAGQVIPFVIGASTGEYIGSVSGNHNITFTATNQLNISKTDNVSLSYINNDFSLSSSGDGTLFVTQTKDFNVFLSQLIPDASLTYQVKYSFDSGTTGNGFITSGGNPVALGSYQTIGLGSNSLTFNASSLGIVNLLIEVKNSNGLLKSTVVMFDVKTTEFSFTGGAQSNSIFVNATTNLNFDLSEIVPSGTNYEMSYYASTGNATIKDAGSTLNAYQWYDITTGAFQRELTALSQGSITVVFTVRNKTTLQTKSDSITISAYQKPTPTDIFTKLDFFDRGGGHEDQWGWYIYMKFLTQSGATITSVVLTVNGEVFNLSPSDVLGVPYGQLFKFVEDNRSRRDDFNLKSYSLKVTDSNGIVTTTTGTWRNN